MHACAATREPTAATQAETKRGVIAPAARPFAVQAAAVLCAAGVAALRTQPRKATRASVSKCYCCLPSLPPPPRILAPPSRLPCPLLISLCISRCCCPRLKQHGTRFKRELRRRRSNRRLNRISTPACARPPAPAVLVSAQSTASACTRSAHVLPPSRIFHDGWALVSCRKCGADVCKDIARAFCAHLALPRS
jgi:hypothetical protein